MNDDIKLLLEETRKTNLILRVVFRDSINKNLAESINDPVVKEILDKIKTKEDTAVNLKKEISQKLKVSEKTVERRLTEMAREGILVEVPAGKTFIYRDAGLI